MDQQNPKTQICPLCGNDSPCEYGDDGLPKVFRCPPPCGSYQTDGRSETFADLNEKELHYLRTFNRNLNRYNCWGHIGKTSAPTILKNYATVEKIVEKYDLIDPQIEYAGGCEGQSPLFVIDDRDQRYTIRLYHSDLPIDWIRSKLTLLQFLSDGDVGALEPIGSSDGSEIVLIEFDHVDQSHAVMFRWIEGVPFQLLPKSEKTPKFYDRVGEFSARLHLRLSQFDIPNSFVVNSKEQIDFRKTIENREDPEDREIGEQFLAYLDSIGKTAETFGIVHGDLTSLNLIYNNSKFSAIDWGSFAQTYFLFDLVQICFVGVPREMHNHFFSGYSRIRPLPNRFAKHIDLFKTVRDRQLI